MVKRFVMVLMVAGLVATACGSGDDDDGGGDDSDVAVDDNDSGDDDGSGFDEITGQGSDFDLSSLPDNFPSELVPPNWDTGQYSDITGYPTVTFESSMSFDDAIAHYDAVYGEGIVVGNDPGERLAQWTRNPPWIVSVFEGDPMMIGITELPEE